MKERKRGGKMGARCEAAVAEKEAEETSDGEKFEYQAEVGFIYLSISEPKM